MFSDKELEGTIDYIDRKIEDILNDDKGSDLDYIQRLTTFAKLREAANKRLNQTGKKTPAG